MSCLALALLFLIGLLGCSTNGDIVMDGEYHEYINNGHNPVRLCQYQSNRDAEDRVVSWRFECE